ncbi:MAG: tRNA preQ1(34) S-adenosylmethionine ribosyltransferase-isomerase QueA [Treponema sp.]|jgi:S-adenosylmethionine:tRNA ribosyltransferase-isomerase|nr:tRNA preQ1(34) S-adenosylmethionine ribosyltransferase-isomerase QueA [Treponema sp.]
MKTADFYFDLPEGLIAQTPPETRGQSRLMTLDRATGARAHHTVSDLPNLFDTRSLLVFNDSRVRKARLFAISKETGARVDFLLIKAIDPRTWQVLVQRARRRHGSYVFASDIAADTREAEIIANGNNTEPRLLRFDQPIDEQWLDRHGHVPLPPYIKREDTFTDSERYQTVYARRTGSAAAPTAGLHFTTALLNALRERGIETTFVTLHVGLGTFLPVRSEYIEEHRMHKEAYFIEENTARQINRARQEGRPLVAVGTTSLRVLESAWVSDTASNEFGHLQAGEGETSIFIYPGYCFKAVDALFTNFHTPQSTLLMLVSAFAGRELILESYAEAVRNGYRFFSYGDAMLIR